MYRLGFFILFLLTAVTLRAQQQTIFSQYMNNVLAVNPAYAGHNRMLNANFMMRFQSVGLKGAPKTQAFSMHSPVFNQRVGLGLQMIHEQIGVSDQTGIYASYSYRIEIDKYTLSMGLQAGANFYKSNYTNLDLYQDGDASFSEDTRSVTPNFGAGVYLHNERMYAGISMPQMIRLNKDVNEVTQYRPLLLMGGYVFDLNEDLKIKPGGLLKFADERPVQLDINATLIIKDVVWAGVSYRPNNAAVIMASAHITDQLVFGYSYDFAINSLNVATNGSHEFLLQYLFRFSNKDVESPRYF
jgi:type IX secretion system PorP/SprF family membrane protein